jgi:hypothetical protein
MHVYTQDVMTLSTSRADDQICLFQRSDDVPFQRTKVEIVNRSPEVLLFHDFVTDREARRLKEIAMMEVKTHHIGLYL